MRLASSTFRLITPLLGTAFLAVTLLAVPALAKPAYKDAVAKFYGIGGTRLDNCNLCHSSGGGSPRNAYGVAFAKSGMGTTGIQAIDRLDSDGDGVANGDEIRTGHWPADPRDTPTAAEIAGIDALAADPNKALFKALAKNGSPSGPAPIALTAAAVAAIASDAPDATADSLKDIRMAIVAEQPGQRLLVQPFPVFHATLGIRRESDGTLGEAALQFSKQHPAPKYLPAIVKQLKGRAVEADWTPSGVEMPEEADFEAVAELLTTLQQLLATANWLDANA